MSNESWDGKLIPIEVVSEKTGIKARTWRNWIAKNKCPLPVVRLGSMIRFRGSDLRRLLRGEEA